MTHWSLLFCCHRCEQQNKNLCLFSLAEVTLGNPLKVIAQVDHSSHASVCHQSDHALMPQCYYCRGLVLMHGISQGWSLEVKASGEPKVGGWTGRGFGFTFHRGGNLCNTHAHTHAHIRTFSPFLTQTRVQHDRPAAVYKMLIHCHRCTHMHSHFKLLTGLSDPDLIFFSKGSFVGQPLPMK